MGSDIDDIVARLHDTSERTSDVRHVPMRLVHESVFRELIEAIGCTCRCCIERRSGGAQ